MAQLTAYQLRIACQWQLQCYAVVKQNDRKRKFAAAFGACMCFERKTYAKRQYCVKPTFTWRPIYSFHAAILPTLRLENSGFQNYSLMSATQLEELLALAVPVLSKQNAVRQSIRSSERLALTLR